MKKKQLITAIIIMLFITLTLLGLTYAYYKTRVVGNEDPASIKATIKKIEIKYDDKDSIITASGVAPGYNNELTPKIFSIKNTGDEAVRYNIVFDEVINEFTKGTSSRGSYNDWTYELYQVTDGTKTKVSNSVITTSSYQRVLRDITINANEEHNYELIVRYKDIVDVDQSDDMGSKLQLRVNIAESTTLWDEAPEGSLLAVLKENIPLSDKTLTVPGKIWSRYKSATDYEAVFTTAEDDYGTTYYFRGLVDNNYVNYSGMCWRIVRIQGDGIIKLALADDEHECNNGYSIDSGTGGYIKDSTNNPINYVFKTNYTSTIKDANYGSGSIPEVIYNWSKEKGLNNEYLAYTNWCNDTSVDAVTYEGITITTDAKTDITNVVNADPDTYTIKYNKTTDEIITDLILGYTKELIIPASEDLTYEGISIKTGVKEDITSAVEANPANFIENYNSLDTDKQKNACEAKIEELVQGFINNLSNIRVDITKTNSTLPILFSKERLLTRKEPSLKCNNGSLNNFISTSYINSMGILTTDEVIYSGGYQALAKGTTVYPYYYLYTDATLGYWTMTPMSSYLYGVNAPAFADFKSSGTYGFKAIWNSLYIRPVIALRSDVLATFNSDTSIGAVGTYTNPYVITETTTS